MPKGKPTATTSSPGCRFWLLPSVAGCRSSGRRLALITARSFSGCTPITSASDSVPSAKVTWMRLAPCTTCKLVRMTPSSEITTPEPTPRVLHLTFGVFLVFVLRAAHAPPSRCDQLRGARGTRRQLLGVQGVQHRRVDVVLGQGRWGAANLPGQGPSERGAATKAHSSKAAPNRQALQTHG
jgi:hypothetical protein